MKSKVLPTIILLIILFFVFLFIYIRFYNQELIPMNGGFPIYQTACGIYKQGEVKIDSKTLHVDIADDICKQELGLSGKKSLSDSTGMIFIFGKLGNYGFWMQNMNFPLDILWINDNFEVVGMEKSLATSTYPGIFGENYLTKYVLEIPAGYSDKNNIKVGDKIIFYEK